MKIVPKILISKCLEHENCRFDGGMIGSSFIRKMKEFVEFIPVCPEVEIGLGVPREAIRIVEENHTNKLVHSYSGNDVTEEMYQYSKTKAEEVRLKGIHGVILKSKSPTCGIKDVKIYNGIGKAMTLPEKTEGMFSKHLLEKLPLIPFEDEMRLTNFNIREEFLMNVFMIADFDSVKKSGKMNELVRFQSEYKYMLMAFDPIGQKELGKIVANHNRLKIDDLVTLYEAELNKVMSKSLSHGRNTNMLMHIFGYFSDDLSSDEKHYFLMLLEEYRKHLVPFSVLIAILKSWAIRFNQAYLIGQKILDPYPRELIEVTDSGKGID